MFTVLNKKNIKSTLVKNPLMCYGSMPGACGPSGLCVVYFDDGSSYGYNSIYDEDQEMIKQILEFIPELGACGIGGAFRSKVVIEHRRVSQLAEMFSIDLGLGNYVYLKLPLFKQFKNALSNSNENRFTLFRKYIQAMGYLDLFEMWQIAEKALGSEK